LAPCEFFDIDEEGSIESEEPEEPEEPDYEKYEEDEDEDEELVPRDFIDIYIINRNHIREQSKSVIPVCGVLLTGVFGLLYFIFRGDNSRIQINQYVIYFLFAAAITLVFSILASIKSVQASPYEKLPWTTRLYLSYIVDIYNREYMYGRLSIWLLGIALVLSIIITSYFSVVYLLDTSTANNVPLAHLPNFIIIQLPRLY
jgi:hypothetical protein